MVEKDLLHVGKLFVGAVLSLPNGITFLVGFEETALCSCPFSFRVNTRVIGRWEWLTVLARTMVNGCLGVRAGLAFFRGSSIVPACFDDLGRRL